MLNKHTLGILSLTAGLWLSSNVAAAEYQIDTRGMHASIQFRIQHLGYSWLYGNFNDFSGQFSFDEDDPDQASVSVSIDTSSIDSNHAERDKHLRSEDFLATEAFPEATFVSTASNLDADGNGTINGKLTLKGITKPVTLTVKSVGAGNDPWGGYRRGFIGKTTLTLADFGIDYELGPASEDVELTLNVEGIRQ